MVPRHRKYNPTWRSLIEQRESNVLACRLQIFPIFIGNQAHKAITQHKFTLHQNGEEFKTKLTG